MARGHGGRHSRRAPGLDNRGQGRQGACPSIGAVCLSEVIPLRKMIGYPCESGIR